MARRHRKRHYKPPVLIDQAPQPTTVNGELKAQVLGGPTVWLFSTDPQIIIECKLRAPVVPPIPRPKISIVDRPGMVSLTHYDGRDPYMVTLPIMFDGFGGLINDKNVQGAGMRSVEREIELLERLAIHKPTPDPLGVNALPLVKTIGPVPDPVADKTPAWHVYQLDPLQERTLFNEDGRRTRWAVDITLIEAVADKLLESSILVTAASQGIPRERYTVREGDTWHKIAERKYHDRSKAKAIAKANGMTLNSPLKPGTKLIIP